MFFSLSGSETIDSTSSHEDYSTIPLCTENDCDEIYRTATKGRQVGRGVIIRNKQISGKVFLCSVGLWNCLVIFNFNRTSDCC